MLALIIPGKLLVDCDTGYHVRIGEHIINTLSIPRYDFFAATIIPIEYIDFEWLSQVIMAFVHQIEGLTGIVIFFSFLIALVFYLLFKVVRTQKGNILIAILITLLAMSASSVHWMARPHIFSMLFFLAWYYILDGYQYRDKNYLYLLPVLMFVWINLHGGFILGFILTGAYFAGNLLSALFSAKSERDIPIKKTKTFALIILIALIASLLNPYGLKGLLHPMTSLVDGFMVHHISEFASPNFHNVAMIPFAAFLLTTIAVLGFSRGNFNAVEFFLTAIFTYFALYSLRNIPFLAIVMAPILVRHIDYIISVSDGKPAAFLKITDRYIYSWNAYSRGYLWLILPVIPVLGLALNGNIKYDFDENTKPVAAVQFLTIESIQGNMFNDYEFGDYVIYRAYPKYKVFIDGRADMYGERFREYFKIYMIKPEWENILEQHNINFVFFGSDSMLSKFLLNDSRWHLIYADRVANIFVRNVPQNKYLLEKYKNIKPVLAGDSFEEAKLNDFFQNETTGRQYFF
jgi:hypothetical protein